MLKFAPLALFLLLPACAELPAATPRPAEIVGETATGQPVYRFRLSRSNALGISPVSDRAVQERALQICPRGYAELARQGSVERRISGVFYTDVYSTVICA